MQYVIVDHILNKRAEKNAVKDIIGAIQNWNVG